MNDQAIEQEIQAKGKTAPRVTPAAIEANIAHEVYFTAFDGAGGAASARGNLFIGNNEMNMPLAMLTFCVLVLRNGFTVTGESACASPENFDAEIGRKIARQNAVQKIWPLMGYQLRAALYAQAAFAPATCTVPPSGLLCTRAPGHDGPCAVVPSAESSGGE